jgi:hypothetical protein
LKESPDVLTIPGGKQLWYSNEDAVPFGYVNRKLLIGKYGDTHGDIGRNQSPKILTNRDNMKYSGRIWLNKKVFSLWLYPKTASEWKRLIADLSKAFKVDIANKFNVELARAWGTDNDDRRNEKIISVKDLMNRLEKKGKRSNIPQHSVDTQNMPHLKSPVAKGSQYVPASLGSKKKVAGLTHTQYHQKRMTSDGVIKLKTLMESPENGEVDLHIEKYPMNQQQKNELVLQFTSDEGITGFSNKYGCMMRFKRTGTTRGMGTDRPSHVTLPAYWEKFIEGKY